MKKAYTYDFPAGPDWGGVFGALEGLSFILYSYRWSIRIRTWNHRGVLSPYWRLLHCTRGRACVAFGETVFNLDRKNILLIPADVETDLEGEGEIDMLYTHFLPLLPVDLEPVVVFDQPIELEATPAHRGLVDALTAPGRERGSADGDGLLFRALLDVCFAEILAPYVGERRQAPDARVVQMLTWMREHYAETLTNEQVARTAGLGKDQAMRLCRVVTGQTLQDHLRGIRLAEATRWLTGSDASIKQIAAACGFANRFHFTRVFTQRLGIGPAAFRRRMT